MKILDIQSYRDGGSLHVETDEGVFWIDGGYQTETPLAVRVGNANAKGLHVPESTRMKIMQALFNMARFGLYAERKGVRFDKYNGDVVLPVSSSAISDT